MTTLPKSLSGAAFMLLATLLFLSPADAFAAKRGTSVRTKRIKLLQEALELTKTGGNLNNDRLKATLEIEQALTALGATPVASKPDAPASTPSLASLKASLEKGKDDLAAALDTMSQKDIAVATPVIGAIHHLDKAIFLLGLEERAAAAQAASPTPSPEATSTTSPSNTPAMESASSPTPNASPSPTATPAPTPVADTNAASSPAGSDQVQPVQPQQENSGQTQPGQPAAYATPAPTNAP